jgi:hypothetical protein
MADAGLIGTKARQRRQRRPAELQGAFVTDEQRRDRRDAAVVKFGSDLEYEAIYEELVEARLGDEARRDPERGGRRGPSAAR